MPGTAASNPPAREQRPDAAIEHEAWSKTLRAISAQPLELKPNFPEVARRFEAWWNHDCIDRPLFLAIANKNPARPITMGCDLLDQPDRWMAERLIDLKQKHWVGDTLPNIRVNFGPVMLGGLLGGRTEFISNTTWTHAFINDDWSNQPSWQIDPSHPWWQQLTTLTRMVAHDSAGRYVMCTPDLGGSADVLMNLRGPDNLCIDVVEQPEHVRRAVEPLHFAWKRAFCELYRIAHEEAAPIFHWLGVWSDQPYVIPACDFNYLIGQREFNRLFLPDIARQSAAVGRAVFHLDGSGAARHVDSLLDIPEMTAIQYVPGSGSPSVLPWVPMLQKIQSQGRSVLVTCPSSEVEELCAQLRPEGLCIMLGDAPTPADLDDLFSRFCRRYGGAK